MTKHERYQRAEFLLKQIIETLAEMTESGLESMTSHFAMMLDEPIQQMIEAKTHMAVAENMESIQKEFRKMTSKENAAYGRKLRDSISKSVSKEV